SPVRAPVPNRVLPDGCMDILFDQNSRDGAFVVGAMTRSLLVESSERSEIVAVRFRPGGARIFFDCPASELTDENVDLSDLWKDHAEITDLLHSAPDLLSKIRRLEGMLLGRHQGANLDPRLKLAIRLWDQCAGARSVESIASEIGWTRQHLARRFQEAVGVSPKFYSKVLRFQHATALARNGPTPDWSALAADSGYFDQSHLIADFQALAGLSPDRWLAETR
ncbi:MAG: DUF6597 domain-containing transcriptional factor, partial [Bdellovibrionota bacterium]